LLFSLLLLLELFALFCTYVLEPLPTTNIPAPTKPPVANHAALATGGILPILYDIPLIPATTVAPKPILPAP